MWLSADHLRKLWKLLGAESVTSRAQVLPAAMILRKLGASGQASL